MKSPFIVTSIRLAEKLEYDRKRIAKRKVNKSKPRFNNFLKLQIFKILGGKCKREAPKHKIDAKNIKKVLVFNYDSIGDYIVSTGIFRWLKAAIPNVQIDAISSSRNKDLMKIDPNIRNIFPVNYTPRYDKTVIKGCLAARKEKYDLIIAINFTQYTKPAVLARIVSLKAKKIHATANPQDFERLGLVFHYMPNYIMHGVACADILSRGVNMHIDSANAVTKSDAEPYIVINENSYAIVKDIVQTKKLKYQPSLENIILSNIKARDFEKFEGAEYCIINFAGTSKERQWDLLQCADYIKKLIIQHPYLKVFVTGAPSSKNDIETVVKTVNNDKCENSILPLQASIAFIAGAKFIASVDTSIVHIAAVVKVPVLGLYHIDKYKIWHPHNTPFVIAVSPDTKTINAIDNDTLIKATELLLNEVIPNFNNELTR